MIAVFVLSLICTFLRGADRSFLLETNSPTPYTSTYLGSGLLSLSSSPLGIDPAQPFMAGVYDHAKGDVPRLAVLPSWNTADLYDGAHWLNGTARMSGYRQTLDLYDGSLRTQ